MTLSIAKGLLAVALFQLAVAANLRVVSLNMNGRLNQVENFKRMLSGEHIVVLQEVNDVAGTRAKYRDYPHKFHVTTKTTKWNWWQVKRTSNMIVSKVPFADRAEQLIQTDPSGDRWERRAQHVILKTGHTKRVHLFHYHNTYSACRSDCKYEREGMQKFIAWVKQRLGVTNLASARDVIIAGDFNLMWSRGASELLQGVKCSRSWVDYVCSSLNEERSGVYNTKNGISDVHNAPWAQYLTQVSV